MSEPSDTSHPGRADPELIAALAPWVDRFCRAWFRLEVRGLHHIPEGAALLVGNHNSGITFVESLGFGARVARSKAGDLGIYGLTHDAMMDLPVVGELLARLGAVRASHDNAAAVFAHGDKVMVFPGGNLEAFRPWTQRDRIMFGGRTGFIKLALRHQVPIVPVVFHGGHGGLVVLSSGRRLAKWSGLARRLRLDTMPIFLGAPWGVGVGPLFHLPLPVRCVTEVLPPIALGHGPEAAEEPEVCAALYEQVTACMQEALTRLSG